MKPLRFAERGPDYQAFFRKFNDDAAAPHYRWYLPQVNIPASSVDNTSRIAVIYEV